MSNDISISITVMSGNGLILARGFCTVRVCLMK